MTDTYKYLHLRIALTFVLTLGCQTLMSALRARAHAASDSAPGRLSVRIVGVVAEVTLESSLRLANFTTDAAGRKAVIELGLPSDAEVLDALVTVLGRSAVRETSGDANPVARSGSLSLVIERAFPEQTAQLFLRYRAPLACVDGRLVLQMPSSPNLDSQTTQVKVVARMAPGQSLDWVAVGDRSVKGERAGSITVETQIPGRMPWEIVVQPHLGPNRVAFASGTIVATAGGRRAWLGVCRPRVLPGRSFPRRLVVLVDRSNSVSPAGLSLERDAVLQLIQALPSDVRVEIAFFSRTTTSLFPVERLPTTQFLRAFSDAMVPSELGNGTELRDAMLHALDDLSTETDEADESEPRWLWVVTDGALDDGHTIESMRGVAERLAAGQVRTAFWVLRPPGDAPLAEHHALILQSVLEQTEGVLRMSYGSIEPSVVTDWVTELRAGGDWYNINLETDGVGEPIATRLAPGTGVVIERKVAPGIHAIRGTMANRKVRVAIPTARFSIPARPLRPTRTVADGRWPEVRFHLEVDTQSPDVPPEAGSLDKTVVRHGLSMAYLPRARSCYLNRKHADTSRFLAGKVRVGLHFERGELLSAEIMSSELGRPDIEDCLREAAFSLQVARPTGDDFPVLAIVNLVFRPATPQQNGAISADLEAQLDVVLGREARSGGGTAN